MSNAMLARFGSALLVLPAILAAAPAFAAHGLGRGAFPVRARSVIAQDSAAPQWTLKVNGKASTYARPGDIVTLTLRGDDMARATAVLSVKLGATMEVLPFLTGKKSQPCIFKFRIPMIVKEGRQDLHHDIYRYDVQVIGRTKDGTDVQSSAVQIKVIGN